ncbi:hypothetical protein AM588_10003365 [Phytophthora nicotianae]|uniref:Glycoside hydrolase n=1 Tax=Phytophthora nicotianae TaxID=4792 RepID=A0A0W8D4A3_PHYNI|nr:hypothetical protein AM588_10003365 [Phytophthora nicotianae]
MLRSAAFLLALAGTRLVQADTLCSLPPVTYTKAKTAYPASAFAIEALEKYGIATWYSDRKDNGDYAQTAANLVSSCPEDSRISIVVYGLPNKDCAAKESAVGSTVQSASDYVTFLNTLTSTIGNRKVLYILEPDAIGLLADTTGCGNSAGYLANLQTAIGLLSQNENAVIYLDTGISNVDYFIWAKPPGDSDGTCDGRTPDSMQGPGAGVFFNELFQSLWNQGTMVTEKGYPVIDGTVRSSTGSASTTQTPPASQNQDHEVAFYNATAPSTNTASSKTSDSTPASNAGQTNYYQSTQTSLETAEQGSTPAPPLTPIPVSKAADSEQISTESSRTSTVGMGMIVLIAVVAAAVVVLAAIVGIRRRQKKMVNAAKTPELSALAPLPTTIVDFRPHRRTPARDSNIL